MNAADLSLCKELYELSGWEDARLDAYVKPHGHEIQVWDATQQSDYAGSKYEFIVYAYDLGYLLRKLPKYSLSGNEHGAEIWVGSIFTDGSTPENAVCSLAIELIKQKVITV